MHPDSAGLTLERSETPESRVGIVVCQSNRALLTATVFRHGWNSKEDSEYVCASPRRSFLAASAAVGAACPRLLGARSGGSGHPPASTRPGPTTTERSSGNPSVTSKVRVGIVGHGVCQFGLAFDLQTHPNVELVAVERSVPGSLRGHGPPAKCSKTYPSLEEMVKDDSIEAIYCAATDAPATTPKHAMLCMRHGKHVATAVPAFRGDIEDAGELLECCKANKGLGLRDVRDLRLSRRSLRHGEALSCIAGVFGRIVYSEGEYCHPHSLGVPATGFLQ